MVQCKPANIMRQNCFSQLQEVKVLICIHAGGSANLYSCCGIENLYLTPESEKLYSSPHIFT